MRTPFAPMGQQTVLFAKQYEEERLHAAGRRRHGVGRWVRVTWAASFGRAASIRPTRTEPTAVPHTPHSSQLGGMVTEGLRGQPGLVGERGGLGPRGDVELGEDA